MPRPASPFPDLLRAQRVRAGLTQRALADLSTVSPRAIRDLESGRAQARARTLHLLADALRLKGLPRELFIHAAAGGQGADASARIGPGVPEPVNALVGRDAEVAAVVDGLASGRRRMVCLSGLPGVGKTRVAAEAASRLAARRGWPVLWLGTETSAAGGPPADPLSPLLRGMRALVESGEAAAGRVCQVVGQHEALLVLDGIADVRAPAGVAELLAYCPGVRVVSTSRVPWHVPGVQASVLSPLTVPPDDGGSAAVPVDVLASVPSVRLLVDRLCEVRPGFALSPATAPAAAALCRRLDGLPLALEVVARWFRVLSLGQLAALPAADLLRLSVPVSPAGGPATMGGLFAWSVGKLSAGQQEVLRELACFEGAWTVADAALALGRPAEDVLDDLIALIGSGLVESSHGESAASLRMPQLLRAFLASCCQSTPTFVGLPGPPPATHSRIANLSSYVQGGRMGYNSAEALRTAGILGGQMSPELEEFYGTLTKEETDVLISVKGRLDAVLPDVQAHSQDWTKPEATQQGFDAAMLCACGLWSGSGGFQRDPE